MEHLLAGDGEQYRPPPLDRLELLSPQTLIDPILQTEGGEEVLAHEGVFQFGCLADHVDQLLSAFDDQGPFGREPGRTPCLHDVREHVCFTPDRMAGRYSITLVDSRRHRPGAVLKSM